MARLCGKHHLRGVWGRAASPTGSATGTLWVLSQLAESYPSALEQEREGRSQLARYAASHDYNETH